MRRQTWSVTDAELAKLSNALELHDSRVSQIELLDSVATIYFSHAYIHKPKGRAGRDRGTGWSQAALLVLSEVQYHQPLQLILPNTISEGFLEVGGIKYEIIPLPFKRKVGRGYAHKNKVLSLVEQTKPKPRSSRAPKGPCCLIEIET